MARARSRCRLAGALVLGLAISCAAGAAGSEAGKRPTNTFTMIVNAPPAPAGTTGWSHAPLPSSASRAPATSGTGGANANNVPLLRGAGTLSMSR